MRGQNLSWSPPGGSSGSKSPLPSADLHASERQAEIKAPSGFVSSYLWNWAFMRVNGNMFYKVLNTIFNT